MNLFRFHERKTEWHWSISWIRRSVRKKRSKQLPSQSGFANTSGRSPIRRCTWMWPKCLCRQAAVNCTRIKHLYGEKQSIFRHPRAFPPLCVFNCQIKNYYRVSQRHFGDRQWCNAKITKKKPTKQIDRAWCRLQSYRRTRVKKKYCRKTKVYLGKTSTSYDSNYAEDSHTVVFHSIGYYYLRINAVRAFCLSVCLSACLAARS